MLPSDWTLVETEQGCKTRTNKKVYMSCRKRNERVLKSTFAYLKLAGLKMDKYAINLKWCLTRWWSSWQPDYFTKLTASHPRLSQSKYTYQDSTIQRRSGPIHSHKITHAFCSMLLTSLLHHHPPPPSQTLIHILQSFPTAPHPVPSAEKEILALLWILTTSYHQLAAAQRLGSTQTLEKTAITHQPKGGNLTWDCLALSQTTASCI